MRVWTQQRVRRGGGCEQLDQGQCPMGGARTCSLSSAAFAGPFVRPKGLVAEADCSVC
jgi:hypothetical protein